MHLNQRQERTLSLKRPLTHVGCVVVLHWPAAPWKRVYWQKRMQMGVGEVLCLLAFLCVTKAGDSSMVQLLLRWVWKKSTGHGFQSVDYKSLSQTVMSVRVSSVSTLLQTTCLILSLNEKKNHVGLAVLSKQKAWTGAARRATVNNPKHQSDHSH